LEEKEELGGFRNLKSRNFSIGEVGVNLNGDLDDRELVQRARIIQKKGIRVIWVGEFEGFRDPFEVAEILASETKLVIGFGILSPSRRECKFIRESYCELIEKYGDRFILGLGAGNLKDRDLAYKLLVKCVKELEDLYPLVGCSSPKVVRFSSLNSAGILYNSVDPTIIEWLKKFELRKIFSAAYGPALILPSQYDEDLLLAASIILQGSSKFIISKFNLSKIYNDLRKLDLPKLIELRRRGDSIKCYNESYPIFKYKKQLLEKFTISGEIRDVINKILELLKFCDHVVLSDPFFRDINSISILDEIVVNARSYKNYKSL